MPPTSKAQTKNSIAILKDLEMAIKNALPLSNMINSLNELQDENNKLRQKLERAETANREKDQQLQEHGKELNSMLTAFEKRYQDWSKKEESMIIKVQNLQEEADKKTRSNQAELAKKHQEYDADLNQLRRQLDDQRTIASGLKSRLEEKESNLQRMKEDIGVEALRPAFMQEVRNLEASLQTLCSKFFEDPPSISHQGDMRMVVQQPGSLNRVSRLASSIASSVYPRPVLAQAIIAERMSAEIFSQLYMASPVTRVSMGEAIQRSSDVRPRQKAILRSLFFKVFSTEERRLQDDVLGSVLFDVMQDLKPLMSHRVDAFQGGLEGFLRSAAHLWDAVRRSSQWVIATSSSNMFNDSWRFCGNVDQTTALSNPSLAALVLFPHIFCEGDEKPLYPGLLWLEDSGCRPRVSDNTEYSSHEQTKSPSSSKGGTVKIDEWKENSDVPGTGRSLAEQKGGTPVSGSSVVKSRDAKHCISRKSRFNGNSGD